jgi:hypothetical protein
MDTDATMSGLAAEIKKNIELMEQKNIIQLQDSQDQLKADMVQISEELKSSANLAVESASRSITMMEVDVERMSKIIKNQEMINQKALQDIRDKIDTESNQYDQKIKEARDMLLSEISKNSDVESEVIKKVLDIETEMRELDARVEDKFNFKTIQIDSTMEAFKEELGLRANLNDVEQVKTAVSDFEVKLEGYLASKQNFVTKSEMIAEALSLNTKVDGSDKKLNEMESQLLQLQELAKKNAKLEDITKLDKKYDVSIAELKTNKQDIKRSVEQIKMQIDNCTSGIAESEEKLTVIEAKMEQVSKLASSNVDTRLLELAGAIKLKADSETLKEVDEKYTAIMDNMHDTLNVMQSALMEKKKLQI